MSRLFFEELEIPEPDYNLGIGGGTHGQNTGRMLEAIENVLMKEEPDVVLVYGDTDSTLAGALAAVKIHIPVAHVEAGLRSFNRRMPEEINRVLTDHASDLLLAPSETVVKNLISVGIPEGKIHLVGDVMYDAALYYGEKAERRSKILEDLGLKPKGYILATVHWSENTDGPNRLKAILEVRVEVNERIPVVFPVHPRTRKRMENYGLEDFTHRAIAIDPVGYLDMIRLEKNARLIVTDSGGVRKEAFFHQVPFVTLRGTAEWVELVALGWNKLVSPTDKSSVLDAILRASQVRPGSKVPPNLYGTGRAAEAIGDVLVKGARVPK